MHIRTVRIGSAARVTNKRAQQHKVEIVFQTARDGCGRDQVLYEHAVVRRDELRAEPHAHEQEQHRRSHTLEFFVVLAEILSL